MAFLKLKPTSRLGRQRAEAGKSLRVGNPHAEPASSKDTTRDAEGHVYKSGDDVTCILGENRGKRGLVFWTGYAERGGSPRAGVRPKRGPEFFVDQSVLVLSIDAAKRFTS